MDVNALASEFGSDATAPAAKSDTDIHSLAAEFGSKKKAEEIAKDIPRLDVYRAAPPISGATKEQSDIINAQPQNPGGANPRDTALAEGIRNFVPNVGKAIGQNFVEGGQNFSQGLGDIVNQGQLGSGAKKMGLGALQAATAIPAGVASEGVGKPVTELTGNPDIGDRAAFLAGSAIPVVPGLDAVSKIRPSNVALKDLIENITNKGANPENLVHVVQNMKANPRLGPADLNPAVLSATQKLFTTEGDTAKNYLASTSANRMATSPNTIKDAYTSSAGVPVNAVQKLKELSEASKKVGNEQINPAVAGAKPVDLSPVLAHIDSQLKPGVNSVITGESSLPFTAVKKQLADVRGWLANKNEMRTSPEELHKIQSVFRKEGENLLSSADGASRSLGHSLLQVRGKIVDAIDKSSGGKYKPALSNYRDEKHIAEAFHDAYNGIFSNSKKLENRPEFTKEYLDGLTKHELEAAKEGARLAIDTEIGVAKNPALAGQNIVKSDFNKQKMEMLLGKAETDKLLQKLEHERLISNTHNKIVENSQTAMRIAADSKRDLPKPTPPSSGADKLMRIASIVGPEAANFYGTGYALPGIGLAASLAANAGGKAYTAGKDAIKIALAKEGNAQYAKMALPIEGPHREALIKSLEAAIPGPKQSIVRRGAHTLSRLVAP